MDFSTQSWSMQKTESINYIISPNKKLNILEVDKQNIEINQLCDFFQCLRIKITYYSGADPKELF